MVKRTVPEKTLREDKFEETKCCQVLDREPRLRCGRAGRQDGRRRPVAGAGAVPPPGAGRDGRRRAGRVWLVVVAPPDDGAPLAETIARYERIPCCP